MMEGFKFRAEKEPHADIQSEPNEEGSFDAVNFNEAMEQDVASIRKNNPEAGSALDIIENDNIPRGVREKMKAHLHEVEPEFNWDLYFELKSGPTLH